MRFGQGGQGSGDADPGDANDGLPVVTVGVSSNQERWLIERRYTDGELYLP